MNRQVMLEGPVAPALARLAWPVLVVLAVQTLVGVAETYFVSSLGTAAVAGVALVFPLFMLMTMMSNGGIGGGVSAAIARAVGGGRARDADALLLHAVVLAAVFGALFSASAWIGGPILFRYLGARDETLSNAILYSNLVFAAAIPTWIMNLLASALRGAGNVRVPALVSVAGAVITLGLSPLLIFGFGQVPGFGVAGAALAMIAFNTAAAGALAIYLRRSNSTIRLVLSRLDARHFKDILRVGLPSAAGTAIANLTVVTATGFVAGFGADALAGYGLASRLDYLLIPLLFAIGTASVTMVGVNIGAGRHARARAVAWAGARISIAATASIGFAAWLFPEGWMHIFTREPEVVAVGAAYLARVAPLYAFMGLGMALYFASQGAGRMFWPFSAGVLRLATVLLAGSYWIHVAHGSTTGLFWIVAASQIVFGGINAIAMVAGRAWNAPPALQAART